MTNTAGAALSTKSTCTVAPATWVEEPFFHRLRPFRTVYSCVCGWCVAWVASLPGSPPCMYCSVTHDLWKGVRYIQCVQVTWDCATYFHNVCRYLHGIAQRRQDTVSELRVVNQSRLGQPLSDEGILDRSTRVSLTIRHVPKTFKIKLKLK